MREKKVSFPKQRLLNLSFFFFFFLRCFNRSLQVHTNNQFLSSQCKTGRHNFLSRNSKYHKYTFKIRNPKIPKMLTLTYFKTRQSSILMAALILSLFQQSFCVHHICCKQNMLFQVLQWNTRDFTFNDQQEI